MPRTKQFDIADVIHKTMEIFWDNGYKATSLDDLVQCMGIDRDSLYNTFGDKHSLFIDTLIEYKRLYLKPLYQEKMKAHSPRQAILALFRESGEKLLKGEKHGCYVVNVAIELAPYDEKASKIVEQSLNFIEKSFFLKMIKHGQASGEISRSVNPTKTARALLSMYIGLYVIVHSRPQKSLMESVSSQAEALIPPGDAVAIPSPAVRRRKRPPLLQVV